MISTHCINWQVPLCEEYLLKFLLQVIVCLLTVSNTHDQWSIKETVKCTQHTIRKVPGYCILSDSRDESWPQLEMIYLPTKRPVPISTSKFLLPTLRSSKSKKNLGGALNSYLLAIKQTHSELYKTSMGFH